LRPIYFLCLRILILILVGIGVAYPSWPMDLGICLLLISGGFLVAKLPNRFSDKSQIIGVFVFWILITLESITGIFVLMRLFQNVYWGGVIFLCYLFSLVHRLSSKNLGFK
jgi:hypothetical protein